MRQTAESAQTLQATGGQLSAISTRLTVGAEQASGEAASVVSAVDANATVAKLGRSSAEVGTWSS